MATYATDLTVLDACDSATGWSELPSPHSSGSAPATDSENYFQNAIAISQATGNALNDAAGIQFDNGSDLTWTAASNWVVMAWSFYAAPTNLKDWATGGMRLGIGSADNNAKFFNAMGNNFAKYPYGGWQCTAIDPEFAAADFTLGTPGAGYRNFAILPNVTAKISKGSPLAVDILRYGRGEFQVTGTGADFSGMATANDNPTTGRWGLFQSEGGNNYSWKGLMSLGLSGSSVTFSDADKRIQLEDTPRVLAGFNKIEVNNAGSSITWASVTIAGAPTSITGSAPVSPGDFEVVDNATVSKTSCVFTSMGTWKYQSNSTIDTCVYHHCKQITQGGATFTGCIFNAPNVAVNTACLKSDDLEKITECDFTSAGTGHAIELTSLGDGTLDWNNTTTGYDIGAPAAPVVPTSTGDETIWVNVGSGTLTINVAVGATVPSIRSAGATVNIVSGQVTVEVNVETGLAGDTPYVFLAVKDGALNVPDYTTNTVGVGNIAGDPDFVVTNAIPGDTPQDGWLLVLDTAGGATNYEMYHYSSWAGSTFTLDITDHAGGLTTTYTSGNDVFTAVLYMPATGAGTTKVASNALTYSSPMALIGWVRSGSSATPDKPVPISGTVGVAGLSLTVVLDDEA